jgi:hypothetical protein
MTSPEVYRLTRPSATKMEEYIPTRKEPLSEKKCPECGATWDKEHNRCSVNCQIVL